MHWYDGWGGEGKLPINMALVQQTGSPAIGT